MIARDRNADNDTATGSGGLEQRIYAIQDANWNTTAIIAASGVPGAANGNVINRFVYSPYGVSETLTASWTTAASPLVTVWNHLFQGLKFTETTGLAYVRNRDYSASLGRFIERDPIGFSAGDNNWYRFVGNAPSGATDPSGRITRELKSNAPYGAGPRSKFQVNWGSVSLEKDPACDVALVQEVRWVANNLGDPTPNQNDLVYYVFLGTIRGEGNNKTLESNEQWRFEGVPADKLQGLKESHLTVSGQIIAYEDPENVIAKHFTAGKAYTIGSFNVEPEFPSAEAFTHGANYTIFETEPYAANVDVHSKIISNTGGADNGPKWQTKVKVQVGGEAVK
jgi:RHS repeat-associated protein